MLFFTGVLHFTKAANSEAFWIIVGRYGTARHVPLAGFYGGSSRLLTSPVIKTLSRLPPSDEGPLCAGTAAGLDACGRAGLLGLELRTEDDLPCYRLLEQDASQLADFCPMKCRLYEWLNGSYYYVDAMGGVRRLGCWRTAHFSILWIKAPARLQRPSPTVSLVDEVYLRGKSMAQVSMRSRNAQLAAPGAFRQASAPSGGTRGKARKDHHLEQIRP